MLWPLARSVRWQNSYNVPPVHLFRHTSTLAPHELPRRWSFPLAAAKRGSSKDSSQTPLAVQHGEDDEDDEWEWVLDEDDDAGDVPADMMGQLLEAAAMDPTIDFALNDGAVISLAALSNRIPPGNGGDTAVTSTEGALRLMLRLQADEDRVEVNTEALRRQFAYYWLRDELGVQEAALDKIVESRTYCGLITLDVQRNLEPKAAFFEALGISRATLGAMISRCPPFISLSLDANIKPTLAWLHWHVGLSHIDICTTLRLAPALLGLSVPANLAPKLDFLRDEVGLSDAQLRRLLVAYPSLLTLSEANLRGKVALLRGAAGGLSRATLAQVVAERPRVLGLALETSLVPRVRFLKRELGLSNIELNRLLSRCPAVLSFNLEGHLRPTIVLLRSELSGCTDADLRLIISRFPKVFCQSKETLLARIGLLRSRLSLSPAETKRVVLAFPKLLAYRVGERLDALLALLCGSPTDAGLGMTAVEARKIIIGLPGLLGCSIETNLRPKVAVLLAAADGNATSARSMLLTSPTLLGYSLSGRIQPRVLDVRAVNASVARTLPQVICLPPAKYATWLQRKRDALPDEQRAGKGLAAAAGGVSKG